MFFVCFGSIVLALVFECRCSLQLEQSVAVGIDLSVDPIDSSTYLALASSFDRSLSSYHFGVKRLSQRPDVSDTGTAIATLLLEGIR